jgi:hypothetical protein
MSKITTHPIYDHQKLLQKASLTIAGLQLTEQHSYETKHNPPHFHIRTIESDVVGKNLIVRCRGKFAVEMKLIEEFFMYDDMISIVNPRYITEWYTRWIDPETSAFIRKAQFGNFLPAPFDVKMNCYGLAFPRYNEDKTELTWEMCVLRSKEVEKYSQNLLNFTEAEQKESKKKNFIEAEIPLVEFKLKQLPKGILEFDLTVVCAIPGIPMMLYRHLVVNSACDGLLNLARHAADMSKNKKQPGF